MASLSNAELGGHTQSSQGSHFAIDSTGAEASGLDLLLLNSMPTLGFNLELGLEV